MSARIDMTSGKLSKRLDNARNSLYAFIEGAVTSITSASVASAQNSGILMAKQMKKSLQNFETELSKVI